MEENVPSQPQATHKRLSLNKRARLLLLVVLILFLASLPSYYFYNQYQKTQALLQNPTASADAQSKEVVTSVGKLIELPANENPTIATVSDVTKLQDQPFFVKAQNGDKVLIYAQAKEAILYRPSINKIITVAPVSLGINPNPSSVLSPSPIASPSPVVVPTLAPTLVPSSNPSSTPAPTVVPQ